MGEWIKISQVVLIVDTIKHEGIEKIIIKKVLKGNSGNLNKNIIYKRQDSNSNLDPVVTASATLWIPWNKKNVVLLIDSWEYFIDFQDINWLYTEKKAVKSVVKMVKTLNFKKERKRIKAFIKESQKGNDFFQEQLLVEIEKMMNPKNFDLVLNYFPKANDKQQNDLIDVFSMINDKRSVPVLIEALSSKNDFVSENAAYTLYTHFLGMKSVTKAFKKHINTPIVNSYATKYFKRYEKKPTFIKK